jgi:hypothetical protein
MLSMSAPSPESENRRPVPFKPRTFAPRLNRERAGISIEADFRVVAMVSTMPLSTALRNQPSGHSVFNRLNIGTSLQRASFQ